MDILISSGLTGPSGVHPPPEAEARQRLQGWELFPMVVVLDHGAQVRSRLLLLSPPLTWKSDMSNQSPDRPESRLWFRPCSAHLVYPVVGGCICVHRYGLLLPCRHLPPWGPLHPSHPRQSGG